MAAPSAKRRKFLVVVDETEECRVALRFAARRAEHTGGIVSLLALTPPPDMQQWRGVEDIMREEARTEAERQLGEAAAVVRALTGEAPELYVREGKKTDAVLALLSEDKAFAILVLASAAGREGPGPLVSAVAGAHGFPIPVTIVPGALTEAQIDAIA